MKGLKAPGAGKRPRSGDAPGSSSKAGLAGGKKRLRPSSSGRGNDGGGAPARKGGKKLDEEILLAGGSDDVFDDLSDGAASDTSADAAAAAARAAEDAETADERRLRLAKGYLEKLTAATASSRRSAGAGADDEDGDASGDDADGDAAGLHDAVAAKLRDEVMAAGGSLFRPLAEALAGNLPGTADIVFRKGHEASTASEDAPVSTLFVASV